MGGLWCMSRSGAVKERRSCHKDLRAQVAQATARRSKPKHWTLSRQLRAPHGTIIHHHSISAHCSAANRFLGMIK